MSTSISYNTTPKTSSARAHDYLYDPVFTVPTSKDHDKYAQMAKMSSAQYAILPVFPCMFSDLPNYPRQVVLIRQTNLVPRTVNKEWKGGSNTLSPDMFHSKPADVTGADRIKFFKTPIIMISPDLLPAPEELVMIEKKKKPPAARYTRCTQTMYRESSAQTSPWKPPDYVITDNSDPEILKLNFLRECLPAGMHEVEIIKRARKKRAWEKAMPEITDEKSMEIRRNILDAIETDEFAFREQEIQDIQDLRLELLELMLKEILDASFDRAERKLQRISTRLRNEREEKLAKLKYKTDREIRRLNRIYQGVNMKYKNVNVIEEHADYKSELYGPLMRHGEHPKRWHEVIKPSKYQPKLIDVEFLNTLPKWLDPKKSIKEEHVKLPGRRLCIRETKWTDPVLKQLHKELTNLRQNTKFKCTLRKRIIKQKEFEETPKIDGVPSDEEADYEALVLLQCVIRGRSTQNMIYEGRDKCRELIQELQSTHALINSRENVIRLKRIEVMNQQRNVQVELSKEEHVEEALDRLHGTVVGTLLDFLNKELIRLLDERKAHALALLAERDRHNKEAAEAGRRQVEERRRREHDEMFKQVVKINQETVDLYLRDIITEGIESVSEEQATEYVQKMASKMDEDVTLNPTKYRLFLDKEEVIADMIHHFLIPEVEKRNARQKLKQRQQLFLRTAHSSIFNKFEKLPKLGDDPDEVLHMPPDSDK